MNALKNLKIPCSKMEIKDLRKSLKQMRHSKFQLVFIDGVYDDDSEKSVSKNKMFYMQKLSLKINNFSTVYFCTFLG